MWNVIIIAVLTLVFISSIYLVTRFHRMEIAQKLAKGSKALSWFLSFVTVAVVFLSLFLIFDLVNAIICTLHLALIWLVCDILIFVFKKIAKKSIKGNINGLLAISMTFIYLSVGWYLAHNVSVTSYSIETNKAVSPLRIVQISDSHIGTTFNVNQFDKYISDIQAKKPDLVVITGDYVDDGTSRQEMLASCKALGRLNTKYGVYFSYGNHDRGYYHEAQRGWNESDLESALSTNNVKVLKDEVVPIGDSFYLIGRLDTSSIDRLPMELLVDGLSRNKFSIVLDHYPSDYDEQEASGVDLVLSGHTHGGQMLPINHVGEWIGVNCMTYGHQKRGSTDFIVNSGISCWALQFKTGCKSEYVVVDIVSTKNSRFSRDCEQSL